MPDMSKLLNQKINLSFKLPLTLALGFTLAGCEGSVSLLPNADPALRKPPAVFSADAARREYETKAPEVRQPDFRAQYALIMKEIDLANISNQDRSNVEVWINGKYVVYCPSFEKKTAKALPFTMFYDQAGHHFDTGGGTNPIKSIQVYCDGKMYDVTAPVAD